MAQNESSLWMAISVIPRLSSLPSATSTISSLTAYHHMLPTCSSHSTLLYSRPTNTGTRRLLIWQLEQDVRLSTRWSFWRHCKASGSSRSRPILSGQHGEGLEFSHGTQVWCSTLYLMTLCLNHPGSRPPLHQPTHLSESAIFLSNPSLDPLPVSNCQRNRVSLPFPFLCYQLPLASFSHTQQP